MRHNGVRGGGGGEPAPATDSSFEYNAGKSGPSAMRAAPVNVAKSISNAGLPSAANASASHSTTRPSASVLSTSTDTPRRAATTSPGRYDSGPTAFSPAATTSAMRTATCAPSPVRPARSHARRRPCPSSCCACRSAALMSGAGVEAHALADDRQLRCAVVAPCSEINPRRAVRSAADGVDGGEVLLQQVIAGRPRCVHRNARASSQHTCSSWSGPMSSVGVLTRSRTRTQAARGSIVSESSGPIARRAGARNGACNA